MPFYDFRCNACQRPLRQFFTYKAYDQAQPVCPHCGSASVRRRIGRIAVARGEDAGFDALDDEKMLAGLDAENPRELGQFMRQMSQDMGEDLGDEFGEVVDRLEKGQTPEQIESAMPDLGEGDATTLGDFD